MHTLYQERIRDYYHNPRHYGAVQSPDFSSGTSNPSCGDAVCLQGKRSGDRIELCRFEAKGCVISQAAASMLCEHIIGKRIPDIQALNAAFIQSLIGMQLGPTRLKCALLPLEALQRGLNESI